MNDRPAEDRTLPALMQRADHLCFVAMDFSPRHAVVYEEIIVPAILDAGLQPLRGDEIHSAGGHIIDELVELIQRSRAVVADLTGHNANVFFELGIAHAFKKQVVLMSQDATVPFDLQPRRVLRYDLGHAGKRTARQAITATLASLLAPAENALRWMYPLAPEANVVVLHGKASRRHIAQVDPPVDAAYRQRLSRRSSEASGIWHLSQALARLAWTRGDMRCDVVAADGRDAPAELLDERYLVSLGGPGANPFFDRIAQRWRPAFRHWLGMAPTPTADGKSRYRLLLDGQPYPPEQDDWLARHTDVGLVMRLRNDRDGFVWVVAGVRTYGTEAAVQALTRPALIAEIVRRLPAAAAAPSFWAVVCADFDPVRQELLDARVHAAGLLEPVPAGAATP